MTDPQRSAIRFRVPRLRPSVLPPRTTPAATRTPPARKPPVRPLAQPSTPSPAPPPSPPQEPPSPPQKPPASPLQKPPAPPPQEPPAPPQKPPASPPQKPRAPPQEPPPSPPQEAPPSPPQKLPPSPPQKPPPSPPQKPPPSPPQKPLASPRQKPPTSPPPVRYLSTNPAPPPEPPVQPSPAQQEALVQPYPPRQDEPASMAKTPIQAAPPSSPSQPHVSSKLASSSTGLQPIPQPSSPQHLHPSQQAEAKISTEISSSDYSNSESHIEENQYENGTPSIPNTPQTKPMISHPHDKIPVPESPEICKPNEPQHSMSEETTSKEPPNQKLNDNPVIVTLAGDNRGTSMHIGSGATRREKSVHIYRRYKVNPDENTDSMTDEEEKEKDSKANENEENFSYINCNIQGINNSMVFNCSITEKSPGVHLGSCDKENVNKPKRKYIKSANMSKIKVNSTPSQKHTVRRRCLRGLFMESSDSDRNDPQRPRHHGCRYMSGDKSNKDDKMDVV